MTKTQRCEVAMLAYAFIDSSKQEGLNALKWLLNSLAISFDDFKDFISQMPKDENARFIVYKDLCKLSSEDKGMMRNILFETYTNGGKQGTEYAAFYFREMIDECDLANARIQL